MLNAVVFLKNTQVLLRLGLSQSLHPFFQIHENEDMLAHFRDEQASRKGRLQYRERTVVEHRLGRVEAIQGPKAHYKGTRKNELDVRRAAAVANLQELLHLRTAA